MTCPAAEVRNVPSPDAAPPTLEYSRLVARLWPWDVRVILWMGIAFAGLQLAQAAMQLLGIFSDRVTSWTTNAWGWNWIISALLRSIFPSLLLIGLLGVRSARQGSRRLSVLAASSLLAFAAVEASVSIISMLVSDVRPSLIPGMLLAILGNLLHGYAILVILIVVLMRPDMKAALR